MLKLCVSLNTTFILSWVQVRILALGKRSRLCEIKHRIVLMKVGLPERAHCSLVTDILTFRTFSLMVLVFMCSGLPEAHKSLLRDCSAC
jgi:hypothetical protein